MMTFRPFPSGFLPFLFIPVLVAFFSAAVVSAQDRPVSETAGKSVSLDAMLDSVDVAVKRLEGERGSAGSGTRTISGYIGAIPMTAGVSASGARTYS